MREAAPPSGLWATSAWGPAAALAQGQRAERERAAGRRTTDTENPAQRAGSRGRRALLWAAAEAGPGRPAKLDQKHLEALKGLPHLQAPSRKELHSVASVMEVIRRSWCLRSAVSRDGAKPYRAEQVSRQATCMRLY